MIKFRKILIVMTVVAIAAPLMAQEEKPPTMVAKNYFITVVPGQASQFETAYKSHIQWHVDNTDDWYWHTWQISNGENMGQYIVRTGDHEWADFDGRDEYDARDSAHYAEFVSEFVQDISSNLVVSAPNLSRWPSDGIPKMVEVSVFEVRADSARAFYHAISNFHDVITEKNLDFKYTWSWVANGGNGQTWVLAVPFDSWADYGANFNIPFWKAVEEVHGDFETEMLRKLWSKSVSSQKTFIAAYRPDMSYNPPQ